MTKPAHPLRSAGIALFEALASGWPCIWMGAVPWLTIELLESERESVRCVERSETHQDDVS
ncbi:hypothetical protein [Noviherbaspirillum denitrificans]|uniref:Uncharacterized protein n=1 Tax=Noviherbaspirillum denitrificans TaxID=1968433 RepID=A0A254T6W4_9BURK|nr:hypothetical protein [Noviherbaspirillum denitrificans]OWW18376.1 hypothetical protein AYR66_01890 [Noviherbaspirillum denitrificans]